MKVCSKSKLPFKSFPSVDYFSINRASSQTLGDAWSVLAVLLFMIISCLFYGKKGTFQCNFLIWSQFPFNYKVVFVAVFFRNEIELNTYKNLALRFWNVSQVSPQCCLDLWLDLFVLIELTLKCNSMQSFILFCIREVL